MDTLASSLQIKPLTGTGNGTGRNGATHICQLNNGWYFLSGNVYPQGLPSRPRKLRFQVSQDTVLLANTVYRDPYGHWVVCVDSITARNRGPLLVRLSDDMSWRQVRQGSKVISLLPLRVDGLGGLWAAKSNYVSGDSVIRFMDRHGRLRYYGRRDSIPNGIPNTNTALSIGPDGTKWIIGVYSGTTRPYLVALQDINPRPRALRLATGRVDTTFAVSERANIVLED